MYFIGIDPGASESSPGAFAMITETEEVMVVWDWPRDGLSAVALRVIKIVEGFGAKNLRAVLEQVGSAPGQGVSSTCKFCENFGQWQGLLDGVGIKYELVKPRKWQIDIYDRQPKDLKVASLEKAREMFPKADLRFKKYHGRADALLMAKHCKNLYLEKGI